MEDNTSRPCEPCGQNNVESGKLWNSKPGSNLSKDIEVRVHLAPDEVLTPPSKQMLVIAPSKSWLESSAFKDDDSIEALGNDDSMDSDMTDMVFVSTVEVSSKMFPLLNKIEVKNSLGLLQDPLQMKKFISQEVEGSSLNKVSFVDTSAAGDNRKCGSHIEEKENQVMGFMEVMPENKRGNLGCGVHSDYGESRKGVVDVATAVGRKKHGKDGKGKKKKKMRC